MGFRHGLLLLVPVTDICSWNPSLDFFPGPRHRLFVPAGKGSVQRGHGCLPSLASGDKSILKERHHVKTAQDSRSISGSPCAHVPSATQSDAAAAKRMQPRPGTGFLGCHQYGERISARRHSGASIPGKNRLLAGSPVRTAMGKDAGTTGLVRRDAHSPLPVAGLQIRRSLRAHPQDADGCGLRAPDEQVE